LKHKKKCKEITSTKIEKIYWQIIVAAFTQPLQYYLRDPAANDNNIMHAAAAPSNLDAAITMHFAASCRKLHGSMQMTTPDDNNYITIPLRSIITDSRNA